MNPLLNCSSQFYPRGEQKAIWFCIKTVFLFAASIMSKKAAEGIDALVLEVTYGKAAMMKTEKEARDLARIMVGIV